MRAGGQELKVEVLLVQRPPAGINRCRNAGQHVQRRRSQGSGGGVRSEGAESETPLWLVYFILFYLSFYHLENLNASFLGFNFQGESVFVNFKRYFLPKNKQNSQKRLLIQF